MFCEVERSYIEDGFNLYGLRACVSNFSDCLDLILDRNASSEGGIDCGVPRSGGEPIRSADSVGEFDIRGSLRAKLLEDRCGVGVIFQSLESFVDS